eukprot:XP_011666459.1 PREDICTED: deleted in malignant brain tumors 1 protein-like [Strongylocentrotus purpuratus]
MKQKSRNYSIVAHPKPFQVRLIGGANDAKGRIEVMHDGSWGTVCDLNWDLRGARVVCRVLGFDGALDAPKSASFGKGSGRILLTYVSCEGTEDNLADCAHPGVGDYSFCSHGRDAGAICYSGAHPNPFQVRLVHGSNDAEGRVELTHDGSWGTICDDWWDLRDASVVCRMLGFDGALNAPGSARFGQGSGRILLKYVNFHPNPFQVRLVGGSNDAEGRVELIHDGSWGTICDDNWDLRDAKVVCRMLGFSGTLDAPGSARFGEAHPNPFGIRLVGGASNAEGRVEVLYDGSWGTICDNGWDLRDARVVCRMLGFDGALDATTSARFGQGSWDILLNLVGCDGTEENLADCAHLGIGVNYCRHGEDAGAICYMGVRLVGGSNSYEGRVEIRYNGTWGTVCDDGWDLQDAKVVCRMLRFVDASTAPGLAQFGEGSDDILLSHVGCNGTEDNLADCVHLRFGVHNCQHNEDAGVTCLLGARLVGGAHEYEGRVEILHEGSWGTVCDDLWELDDAKVVCRQLGFEGALAALPQARFDMTTYSDMITSDEIPSTYTTKLLQIGHETTIVPTRKQRQHFSTTRHPLKTNVRLANGSNYAEGRVEVLFKGSWMTVCGNHFWNLFQARVVCRMMGFVSALDAPRSARFGQGSGGILFVSCSGTEDSLDDCFSVVDSFCGHHRDAGAVCYIGIHPSPFRVRLSGGSNEAEGRVEVLHGGSLGTICDGDWDLRDARVVCRILGFDEALDAPRSARFGQGSGRILLEDVNCEGTEDNLAPFQVRLVGGSNDAEGRVELMHDGSWGTICPYNWDLRDARVVCRMLGFDGASDAPGLARIGEGSGDVLLDDVGCDGTEDNLADCAHSGIQVQDCGFGAGQDAGTICYSEICPAGTFGDYCMKNCTCVDGANCSNVDGSCSCEPAFEGAVCDRSEVKVTANRPSNDTISKGNDFTLACQVNLAGIDLDEVASYRDSDKLPDTTDVEYKVDSNPDMGMYYITIRGAGAEDTGAYRCTAVTKGEQFISSSEDILLDVVVLGKIDDDLSRSKDYVLLNGTASLNCTVFSSSEASIAWERNGVQLVDGMNRTSIEPSQEMETGRTYFFSVLKISDITQEEDGIYKCLAFNGAGIMTDSEIFNIFVQDPFKVRLVSGSNDTEGRVEVMYNGSWGTICDTRWDLRDARVVCRMLGFDGALGAPGSATFGQGSGCIHLYDVGCDGTEDNLAVCAHTGSQRYSCNHTSDAGAVCYSGDPFQVRLVNGSNDAEGRVEVMYDGSWGTICDDWWDLKDAKVVCRMLGFNEALAAPISARFGQGPGQSLLTYVRCEGTEDHLADCFHAGVGCSHCSHSRDAGASCSVGDIRLVNGSNNAEGRVEIFYGGSWMTVCDKNWDLLAARVVCRMLGFDGALDATRSASFGQGSGGILYVKCFGTEDSLADCYRVSVVSSCKHKLDAGAVCYSGVGGASDAEGRVEVLYDGSWGTICDSWWDLTDARVVCRMLGFDGALDAPGSARFGQGSGRSLLGYVNCDGNEDNVADCAHAGIGRYSCSHTRDAGAICYSGLHLVGGSNEAEGRVEVLQDGSWGTVCGVGWDLRDARVVCRMLGLDGALDAPRSANFGQGSGRILLQYVNCDGTEDNLADCAHAGVERYLCSHTSDAGAMCYFGTHPTPFQVRLVNGLKDAEGRVEVLYDGSWGTICDSWWDLRDARVVCRMMGFDGALDAPGSARFGQGSGRILLKYVNCDGTEDNLADCTHSGIGRYSCSHTRDAGAICYSGLHPKPFEVRLVGGSNEAEGRVEVMYEGSWGTICDDSWDLRDARVVCIMLGFDGALNAPRSARFGQGSGHTILDVLGCDGTEVNLAECALAWVESYSCGHTRDAGAVCHSGGVTNRNRVPCSVVSVGVKECDVDGLGAESLMLV